MLNCYSTFYVELRFFFDKRRIEVKMHKKNENKSKICKKKYAHSSRTGEKYQIVMWPNTCFYYIIYIVKICIVYCVHKNTNQNHAEKGGI